MENIFFDEMYNISCSFIIFHLQMNMKYFNTKYFWFEFLFFHFAKLCVLFYLENVLIDQIKTNGESYFSVNLSSFSSVVSIDFMN